MVQKRQVKIKDCMIVSSVMKFELNIFWSMYVQCAKANVLYA